MTPPPNERPGAVPEGPMVLAGTAGLHVKIDAFQKSLDDHMALDREDMGQIHTRISGSKRFQYLTTGATMAVIALLGWILATAGGVMKQNMNEVLQESKLVGIPVRVELLQKQMDEKASKEGAQHRDEEIHDLKEKSHQHRR